MEVFSKGASDAEKQEQEAAREESSRQAAIETLPERLTYLGSTRRPQDWTLLGWREGHSDDPVALSRDGERLDLVAGNLGAGKTRMVAGLLESALGHVPGINSPHAHGPTTNDS
jgi:hypothetical protein